MAFFFKKNVLAFSFNTHSLLIYICIYGVLEIFLIFLLIIFLTFSGGTSHGSFGPVRACPFGYKCLFFFFLSFVKVLFFYVILYSNETQ